jgi:hypothetical protein
MDEMLLQMGITFVLTAIKQSFKNPARKEDLKKVMLKIRNQINLLYAGDPDFE